MFKKIKCGDLEHIFPDEKTSSIILKVMDQNQVVIDTNKMLIEAFAKPLFYLSEEKEETP